MGKKYLNKQSLYVGMLLSMILGKIVRHTVMYRTLVVPGIGWSLVNIVNSGSAKFGFTFSGIEINEAASNATLNACYFFSKLNFLHLADSYYGYEVLISIVFNLVLLVLFRRLKWRYTVKESMFIFASVAVLNIFAFCMAKEPVQMIYFILMFYVLKGEWQKNKKIAIVFLIYLLCAVTYRNYYVLMAIFLLYFYFALNFLLVKTKKVKMWHIVLIVAGIFLFHLIFMSAAIIVSPTNYNELIRVRFRDGSGASTIYTVFKSTQPVLFSLDYLLVVLRMLVPIELILMGPKFAIFAIYQILITCILIKTVRQYNSITSSRRIAIAIYLAFLLGSATFEPDFGSWVRHEAVLFPVYLIMAGYKVEELEDEDNLSGTI